MNKAGFLVCVIMIGIAVPFLTASGDAFDDEFQVVKITGTCEAASPGSSRFMPLTTGQRFRYGTTLKTGRNSSAVVKFSSGNGCRVFARTTIEITEDSSLRRSKVLRMQEEGAVRLMLETGFGKNNELKVETPSAVCGAVACDFNVEYRIIGDLKTSIATCNEGEIGVGGEYFSMSDLSAGEQITVAESPDGNFVRIKMVEGDATITITDVDGGDRKVLLNTGDEIQILIQDSPDRMDRLSVIYKIDYADAEKKSEIIQTEIDKDQVREATLEPLPPADRAPAEWPQLTVTTPVPVADSPTPVGKRP